MTSLFNNPRYLIGAALGWTVLVLAAALAWPGPQAPPVFLTDNSINRQPTAVPPVDSGTQLALNEDGTARIFWEIPADGVVQLTIEIGGDNGEVSVDAGEVDPGDAPGPETPDLVDTG